MQLDKATFAAGCFWGVEHAFRKQDGVLDVQVGYTGGTIAEPTYEMVCGDTTGHAEAVEVVFDPQRTSFERLVEVFFRIHNPTQINRQGPDFGTQYRSAIFTHDAEQGRIANEIKRRIETERRYNRPITTVVEPAGLFWPAEEYHQNYYGKRGVACGCL